MVWVPGLVAAEVVGQSSFVKDGLAIVPLIWSLRPTVEFGRLGVWSPSLPDPSAQAPSVPVTNPSIPCLPSGASAACPLGTSVLFQEPPLRATSRPPHPDLWPQPSPLCITFVLIPKDPLPWSVCPLNGNRTGYDEECEKASSTQYFWYRKTLNISPSIQESGAVQWEPALCLILAWLLVYLCILRGTESTGKVGRGHGVCV